MILYLNCCVRSESRTDRLARALLQKLGDDVTEVYVPALAAAPLDEKTLAWRNAKVEAGDFSDPYFDLAKQFAAADTIVISAPFWDLSFPSVLKVYFENVYVLGLTSSYNENGVPVGLCRANTLYYVSTAGGLFVPEYGYHYVRDLTTRCFGVKQAKAVVAEGLDVVGNDSEAILNAAIAALDTTL